MHEPWWVRERREGIATARGVIRAIKISVVFYVLLAVAIVALVKFT